MKTKLATYISIFGHPLLTVPLVATISLFTFEKRNDALLHSSLIVLGVFLPIAIKNYISAKKGVYTNFDVSDKKQRQSWYIFASIPLAIVTIILFATDQPRVLCMSLLFSLLLLVASQLINFFVKSSLHVSFNVFLAFLVLPLKKEVGLAFLVFTIFIAWARVVLKMHTRKEVFVGFVLGLTIGLLYFVYGSGSGITNKSMNFTTHLSPTEFEKIKTFILEKGDRQTYRNFDNNNPHLKVAGFDVYLNASIHQRNINNDPKLSDFNEITICDTKNDIQYNTLQIVREGDKENPGIHVPEDFQSNNVYLVNPYEDDLQKMKENLLTRYLPEITSVMQD